MKCFLCRSDHSRPNSLVKHLKVIHGLCTGRTLYLKCGQEGCSRSFGSFSGFRKHLNKCHISSSFDVAGDDFSPSQSVLATSSSTYVDVAPENEEAGPELSSADLVNSCAAVISDLKAAGVGQSGKVQSEMPLFYQINSILILQENVLLLTVPLCTVTFQEHFHAYEVTRSKEDFVVFHVDNLPYPRPFDIQMSYGVNDTALFVIPHCFLW